MMSLKRNKLIFLLIIIFFVILLIFDFPIFNNYEDELFKIKRGENVFQISNNLKNSGHIKSKILFLIGSFKDKNYTKLKAGKYYLSQGISNQEILNIFIRGEKQIDFVTIIPGFTLNEISRLKGISDKQKFLDKYLYLKEEDDLALKEKYTFLKDKPLVAGLEGYFFPDTYEIDSEETIIDQVLSNFDKKLTKEFREEIEKQEKTIFEIIIMASMIEKEVVSYKDKEIVSGILWKRLKNGMLLEVDSTSLYFLAQNKKILYDTYKRSGLPIGPICNPGIESIKAAIYPKHTDYWFYLSDKNGETIFSKNFNEHIINKFKYLDN